MKTLMQLARQNQHWLTTWVFYPIAAYYASWIVGVFWLMPLVFSLMLVGIQWKRIERLTGNRDAGFWWLSPFLYAFVAWLVWHLPTTYISWPGGNEIVSCALVYFGTQAIGELLISRLVTGWRWGRFALANGLAALSWLAGYCLLRVLIDTRLTDNQMLIWMWVGIPVLSTLSNLITGMGLLAAVGDELTNEPAEQTYEIGYVDQD